MGKPTGRSRPQLVVDAIREMEELHNIMESYRLRRGSIQKLTPCVEAERLKAGQPVLLHGRDLPESCWPWPPGVGSETDILLHADGRISLAEPAVMFESAEELERYRSRHPGYLLHRTGWRPPKKTHNNEGENE